MAFCGKCGTQVGDGVSFCPNCGTPVGNVAPAQGVPNQQYQQYQQNPQYQQNQQYQQGNPNNGPVYTNGYPNQAGPGAYAPMSDAQENKVMGILAYLGILVLIPIFAAPKSKFARFHANQGLVLAIGEVAYGIIQAIIGAILAAIFPLKLTTGSGLFDISYSRGAVYTIIMGILWLGYIAFTVLAIMGIINAVNGKEKELPVIGNIKILK